MLPATHRLSRPDQFRTVGRRGARAGRSTLVVHLRDTGGVAPAGVGFTVGRAVGTAVVRNRVRRRLRHAVAELLGRAHENLLRDGDEVVVRATPAAAAASYAVLREDLHEGLRRARARTTSSGTTS